MIEFDYKLDYKNILFKPNDKRYRIGRGEQGVLLVRPYTNDICKHWRFKTLDEAQDIMLKVHNEGIGICGVYTFEIAETKTARVLQMAKEGGHPLKCTFEPE